MTTVNKCTVNINCIPTNTQTTALPKVRVNTTGNQLSFRAPADTRISAIGYIGGKSINLAPNQPAKILNTFLGSQHGSVNVSLNGHDIELIHDLSQYAGQIGRPEDLKVMIYTPNNANYQPPTADALPLYPYLFKECVREMDSASPNGTEAWQKELIMKAHAQAAQAERCEIQMIEVPAKIPNREFDFSKLEDVEEFYTLLNDPLLGPPTGNFIVLAITVLAMAELHDDWKAALMFWKQMLTTPTVKVVSIADSKFMYFHGGQNFQTMMGATTEKALAIAREELVQVLTKTDPDLWNLGLDQLEAKIDKKLARANTTYVEIGKGYRIGITSSKIRHYSKIPHLSPNQRIV